MGRNNEISFVQFQSSSFSFSKLFEILFRLTHLFASIRGIAVVRVIETITDPIVMSKEQGGSDG